MLAYGLSLSAFRGGPVFPAMFVGAVLGIAMSGLPGMEPRARDRHGHRRDVLRDAPAAAHLGAARRVLLGSDGLQVTPEVIVAVVVAFVVSTILPTPGPPQPVERARTGGRRRRPPAAGSATATAPA